MNNNVKISNEKLTVEISKTGAEIQSIKGTDGTEFIWQGDPAFWTSRAIILFPICGGLKEDRYTLNGMDYTLTKHGFLKNLEFEVEKIDDSSVVFLTKDNEETLKQYPWSFEFRAIFRLEGDSLFGTYAVMNNSGDTMYFSVGAHEGYACPEGIEDYKIIFEKKEDLKSFTLDGNLLEDKYIIVGKDTNELKLLYDYFAVDALVFKEIESRKVTLTNGKREITVDFNGLDHLLLWTKPGAGYICIEPWSGIPDVAGSGYDITEKESITSLGAGKDYEVTHKMTFKTV